MVLGGALIASYPGMTETFFYGFTADGYFLAMLLSALAVLFSAFECKKPWQWAVSAVLLCLTCGIYQAYVSFALVLTVVYFIGEMLEGRRTNGEAWLYIGRQAAIYAVGMIFTTSYGASALRLRTQRVSALSTESFPRTISERRSSTTAYGGF